MKVVQGGKLYDVETIDYWDNLRNQSAIANMQCMLNNVELLKRLNMRAEKAGEDIHQTIAKCAIEYADCLVNELKKSHK